jgi:hypothetical protein
VEVILAKCVDHNGEYLYDIVEMGQEEGLACMTNPKTTSRLYHAVFICMYNNKIICYWWSHPNHNGIMVS